jgi:hypothetical protein
MITISLLLAALAGSLTAALVCKGIHLKLWLDLLAGLGAVAGIWAAAMLAGSNGWPLAGFLGGYAGVVIYLRTRGAR